MRSCAYEAAIYWPEVVKQQSGGCEFKAFQLF